MVGLLWGAALLLAATSVTSATRVPSAFLEDKPRVNHSDYEYHADDVDDIPWAK